MFAEVLPNAINRHPKHTLPYPEKQKYTDRVRRLSVGYRIVLCHELAD